MRAVSRCQPTYGAEHRLVMCLIECFVDRSQSGSTEHAVAPGTHVRAAAGVLRRQVRAHLGQRDLDHRPAALLLRRAWVRHTDIHDIHVGLYIL